MVDRSGHPEVIGVAGGARANGRVVAYALAVMSFFALGLVVYRDDPGDPAAFTQLSPQGRDGYRLWREQNCHTCHQLYGFGGYLGPDRDAWRRHDATALLEDGARVGELLVDQGEADSFFEDQLKPDLLEAACHRASVPLTLRRQAGYDHSYNFIATFMDDHLRWHAARLNA